jgi:hypothetical protein
MNVDQISSPLKDEHLAATSPRLAPEIEPDSRQRLNFWPGRALTADALEIEQEHRASHLARAGQMPMPGIVTGLEVGLEEPANRGPQLAVAGHFLHVLPGHGLTIYGEDIAVPRALRVPLDQIPVRYVRFVATGAVHSSEPPPADAAASTRIELAGTDLELDEFKEGHLPWAAVLVARPAEFPGFGKFDPADPCELDLSRDAFADQRRIDAAIFHLFQLPASFQNDPLLANDADLRWRNRLAYALFEAERIGATHQYIRMLVPPGGKAAWDTVLTEQFVFPWELFGVPLALLGSEAVSGGPRRFFLDRATVARPGGRARSRSRPAALLATGENTAALLPPGAGTPAFWRARVDQFAEHLATLASVTTRDQAAHFQFVPPAGLLPREALDFLTTSEASVPALAIAGQPPDRAAVSKFFPASFAVEAAPIPTEDLDAALAASAPLAPFDLAAGKAEVVRVLVPVAQQVFDPRLLVVELEDPFFARELGRLIGVRQDWRQRRDFIYSLGQKWRALAEGPRPPAALLQLEAGQLEPEPVETDPQLDFAGIYLSPAAATGPREIKAQFANADTLTPDTMLFLRLRVDLADPPSRIEMRWMRGEEQFSHVWTEPSDAPTERRDEKGAPLPLALGRLYGVTARELGATTDRFTSFILHLDDGRVGIIDIGSFIVREGQTVRQVWWSAHDNAAAAEEIGGDWVIRTNRLRAPFEEGYEPTFPDKPLNERLAELPGFGDRPAEAVERVTATGLTKLIETLQRQVDRADDFVDLSFLKTQTHTHRIRQVLLGDQVADDLLVSPILSSVVKKSSARAVEQDLVAALRASKSEAPDTFRPAARAAGTAGATAANIGANVKFGEVPGFNVNLALGSTALDQLRHTQTATVISSSSLPVEDVRRADPAVGKGFDLRTLTIAKRFDLGPVQIAFDYADTNLREILEHLPEFDLDFSNDDLIPDVTADASTRADKAVSYSQVASRTISVASLKFANPSAPASATNDDTGHMLAKGVRRADASVLVLRRLEFYIARRRALIVRAKEVLGELTRQIAAIDGRLAVIAGPLAEARHDVSVARALRQEEQQRVGAINTRRDALIRDEVKFLAYVRPRTVDLSRRNVAGWKLEPADALAPVPACLKQHDQPPDELRAYVQLFRYAPAAWFVEIGPRLRELDTPEKLFELLSATQHAALTFATEKRIAFAPKVSTPATKGALLSAFSIVEASRTRAATFQLVRPELRSWSDFHIEVQRHSSLGDIIDGRHGHPTLARAAAGVLQRIEDLATCMHAEFAAAPPALRLSWVERYSQFDQASPLNNLTALPGYGSLDRAARRRFQAFAEWLFGRVNIKERDAFNLINDLVRICLLLASHAPVKTLIAGHVPRPAPVRPGGLIPVHAFDPSLIRVGMEVHVWQAEKIVAHARVEDLHESGEVSARIERLPGAITAVDETMRVQFVPAALGFLK